MAGLRLGLSPVLEALNGSPAFLGVIVATTTKNNHDTAAPFYNTDPTLAGKILLIQPDAAGYILPGTANTSTVTTSNGVYLGPYERVILTMKSTQGYLAAVSASGTMNVKVWELT